MLTTPGCLFAKTTDSSLEIIVRMALRIGLDPAPPPKQRFRLDTGRPRVQIPAHADGRGDEVERRHVAV